MGFSLTNIYRSTYLRYGLPTIIYFIPALYFQYVSDVDRKDWKILFPPAFVYVLTYVHQLLLNSPATPFRLPYQIDLLFTILEMAAFIIICRISFKFSSDPAFLSLAVFDLVILCVLFLILCLKVGDVVTHSGSRKGPWDFSAKYDYLTALPWSKGDHGQKTKDKFKSRGLTLNAMLLFSRFMVVLFIYFTFGFAWSTIVIAPIRETASIPFRASKSLHHPTEDLKIGVSDVWNVIVGRPTVIGSDWMNHSSSLASAQAVEVSLLSNASNRTPCPLASWQSTNLPQKDLFTNSPMTLDAIAFKCPYKADLLVTVNFTKLGDEDTSVGSPVVQVMLGSVADDPTEVIRRTEVPALLIPGVNFVGFAKMHVLQRFKDSRPSTLGLFASYKTFLVSDIVNLSPDPQALSPTSPPDPRVATMRIIPLIDLADWRIVQEYRDRSVLKGFSIVGGLWTFLGGVFAFLFGKSISLIVFHIKPLSIFGIIDQFQKDRIGNYYRDKYPGIDKDIAEKGYNRFMADHFVALDFVKASSSSTPGASDQTLAGPTQIRRPTQPGPSNQAEAIEMTAMSTIEPGTSTPPQVTSRSGAPTPTPPGRGTLPPQQVPTAAPGSSSGSAPTLGLAASASVSALPAAAQAATSTGPGAGEPVGPHGTG